MKHIFLILILTLSAFAMESAVSIELSPQAKEYLKTLSQQDQKKVTKAIKIGNKFTELYRDGAFIYEGEQGEDWSYDLSSVTVLSGKKITQIWKDNTGSDYINHAINRVTCDKAYLKKITFDKNTIKLTYESLVIGKEISMAEFLKLDNEYLTFELTLNQTPKVTDLKFSTKISSAIRYTRELEDIESSIDDIHTNVDITSVAGKKALFKNQNLKTDIINASSVCKNY